MRTAYLAAVASALAAIFGSALAQVGGAVPATPEVVSPLGARFFARPDKKDAIAQARKKLEATPDRVEAIVALAQAQVDALRLRDAVASYTRAIQLAPDDALLYRYRGHRYISLRQFDRAIADLERGARLDTTRFEIWFHLGLAYYLNGKFAQAAVAYEKAYQVADQDDPRLAASDWLYMSHRREGNESAARRVLERIGPDLKAAEDTTYLDRLLFYKGLRKEGQIFHRRLDERQRATMGYGIGNWHLYSGDKVAARRIFERVLTSKEWAAFGFIAAENELASWAGPP